MITTIQISKDLKDILSKYKKSSKDTYEDVIKELIKEKDDLYKKDINLLKEGYEDMYEMSKEISDEFEHIDLKGFEKNE